MTPTGYRDTTLIGLPEQVANVLRNHHTAGTLVSMTAPRPVSPTDPRIWVAVRLVDTAPVTPPVRVTSLGAHITDRVQPVRRRRTRRGIAIAAAVTTAVVALVYVVGQLVAFLVDNAALIAGFLAVAALLLAALRGATGSGSGNRHCPGC